MSGPLAAALDSCDRDRMAQASSMQIELRAVWAGGGLIHGASRACRPLTRRPAGASAGDSAATLRQSPEASPDSCPCCSSRSLRSLVCDSSHGKCCHPRHPDTAIAQPASARVGGHGHSHQSLLVARLHGHSPARVCRPRSQIRPAAPQPPRGPPSAAAHRTPQACAGGGEGLLQLPDLGLRPGRP